jgi:HAD superfamily hydrolase (TIGR01458 family)
MTEVEGLLLDIDGVLVVSWEPLAGAAQVIERCRSAGLSMRFLTNTTSISRAEIARRLTAGGIPADEREILTAPAATAAWIRATHPDARCYLINSGDLGDDFAGVDLVSGDEDADLVVLGGAGPEFSYQQMNHALGLLLGGSQLVGMHRNWYWRTAEGFSLDTGAYLAALEGAAGVTATVLGKPSPDFFTTALTELGCRGDQVVMVGDDIDNDVLGAQAVGIRGVLVRTGKYRPETEAAAPGRPDLVIDSVRDLPETLARS